MEKQSGGYRFQENDVVERALHEVPESLHSNRLCNPENHLPHTESQFPHLEIGIKVPSGQVN